ncbi:low molecular weight protein-tyrosine-phosphatase [Sphingorhabdus sp. Alg239-R122]|uniref:low molecular weight protein-tyrosine-phosphatase n=1 Tax=Sphingorhabdus sp. Alg239-R122 TaxID=2305989 RepID=UPI0013DC6AFC|nr:low molecular weight protein-tyrosine-phosphatase [Sphingorhabdus sp. Alg239-R122]
MQKSVLFVCLGNICRSPLAEGAMRDAVLKSGQELLIDSAGTGAWHIGNPPDPRSIAVAAQHGVDISGQRARQVVQTDFARFTHIIALDRNNLSDLQSLKPRESGTVLSLLLDHLPGREGQDVADPYYGDDTDFMRAWQDVSAASAQFCRSLR